MDVMWGIMPELGAEDLATAARVCKEWLPAAQSSLYRHISIRASNPRSQLLARTLISNEHLRSLVRHVALSCFNIGGGWYRLLLSWIALLPENALLSVDLEGFYDDKGSDFLMDYPAIRTARYFTLRPPVRLARGRLAQLLAYPNLQGLSVGGWGDALPAPDAMLHLQPTRSAFETSGFASHLSAMLDAIDSDAQFKRFDVQIGWFGPRDAALFIHALKRHADSLTRLTMLSHDALECGPFMDDLVPALQRVQYLCCAFGTYTIPGLLSNLPSSVHTLVLAWGIDGTVNIQDPNGHGLILGPDPNNIPFPSEELATTIRSLAAVSRLWLRQLAVALPNLTRERCQPVAVACADVGIAFTRVWTRDLQLDTMVGTSLI
ncbi:hypothetical protein PsYK624_152460 [Phanerochaete sordida]|uniref:F-box domain-containing protein n=1 Tax=Phanerochaete sordida TaxID=48140 RepID=A0A9P3GQ29_9APHY|nr:hypothetical protein PsYK624_152460 [Phanerochaete sordida]